MGLTDIFSLKRPTNDESRIQTRLAPMDYDNATSNRPRNSRRGPPRRKSLSMALSGRRRRSMNEGDAAVQFKEISKQLDDCHKTMMQELRRSNMSMKKKLDFALKKRGECADSRAELHFEEEDDYGMNGGRRKRRRKTRRNKKRKSRRKSRKRKRKTKRRR